MRILVAEDEKVSRLKLEKTLEGWGFEVVSCVDGDEAWKRLCEPDPPRLCLLDWLMPGLEGVELCRKVRATFSTEYFYLILLTAKQGSENIVDGLEAGADDYVTKPFMTSELRSRLDVGRRILSLEATLSRKITQLESALEEIRHLKGLLPICSYCHKIRNDEDYWEQVETYISRHAEVEFSHSICPSCYKEHVQPMLDDLDEKKAPQKNDAP